MKIFQKKYCQIGVGDVLYIVHDNDILEKLTVTENHLSQSAYMKPNEKVVDNLYLASNYYEITDDGRLRLNTLKNIYPENGNHHELFRDTKLSNVFVDQRNALQFAENRKNSQNFNKNFTEYPYILIYNTRNDEIFETIPTTNPLKFLRELVVTIADFKSQGINVDIAVFDSKKCKLIKDLEILNIIRKIIK